MIYYIKIGLTKKIDLTKSKNNKECIICHYWHFNHGFIFQKLVCSGCPDFLTLLLPVTRCAGYNTDLASNSNISKTVKMNIAFKKVFFKEYSISFLIKFRLIDFGLVLLQLLMFKVCGITGISKIVFCNFSGTERVKQT